MEVDKDEKLRTSNLNALLKTLPNGTKINFTQPGTKQQEEKVITIRVGCQPVVTEPSSGVHTVFRNTPVSSAKQVSVLNPRITKVISNVPVVTSATKYSSRPVVLTTNAQTLRVLPHNANSTSVIAPKKEASNLLSEDVRLNEKSNNATSNKVFAIPNKKASNLSSKDVQLNERSMGRVERTESRDKDVEIRIISPKDVFSKIDKHENPKCSVQTYSVNDIDNLKKETAIEKLLNDASNNTKEFKVIRKRGVEKEDPKVSRVITLPSLKVSVQERENVIEGLKNKTIVLGNPLSKSSTIISRGLTSTSQIHAEDMGLKKQSNISLQRKYADYRTSLISRSNILIQQRTVSVLKRSEKNAEEESKVEQSPEETIDLTNVDDVRLEKMSTISDAKSTEETTEIPANDNESDLMCSSPHSIPSSQDSEDDVSEDDTEELMPPTLPSKFTINDNAKDFKPMKSEKKVSFTLPMHKVGSISLSGLNEALKAGSNKLLNKSNDMNLKSDIEDEEHIVGDSNKQSDESMDSENLLDSTKTFTKYTHITGNLLKKTSDITGNLPKKTDHITGNLPKKTDHITGNLPKKTDHITGNLPKKTVLRWSGAPSLPNLLPRKVPIPEARRLVYPDPKIVKGRAVTFAKEICGQRVAPAILIRTKTPDDIEKYPPVEEITVELEKQFSILDEIKEAEVEPDKAGAFTWDTSFISCETLNPLVDTRFISKIKNEHKRVDDDQYDETSPIENVEEEVNAEDLDALLNSTTMGSVAAIKEEPDDITINGFSIVEIKPEYDEIKEEDDQCPEFHITDMKTLSSTAHDLIDENTNLCDKNFIENEDSCGIALEEVDANLFEEMTGIQSIAEIKDGEEQNMLDPIEICPVELPGNADVPSLVNDLSTKQYSTEQHLQLTEPLNAEKDKMPENVDAPNVDNDVSTKHSSTEQHLQLTETLDVEKDEPNMPNPIKSIEIHNNLTEDSNEKNAKEQSLSENVSIPVNSSQEQMENIECDETMGESDDERDQIGLDALQDFTKIKDKIPQNSYGESINKPTIANAASFDGSENDLQKENNDQVSNEADMIDTAVRSGVISMEVNLESEELGNKRCIIDISAIADIEVEKSASKNLMSKETLQRLLDEIYIYYDEESTEGICCFNFIDRKEMFKCLNCSDEYKDIDLLLRHLCHSVKCGSYYKQMKDAIFSQDPPNVSDSSNGEYMEVYGCYMCDFQAYSAHSVRVHWLLLHIDDAMYVCKYCNARFHTSYKNILHVLQYHPLERLVVSMSVSPMYNKHLEFDLEDKRDVFARQSQWRCPEPWRPSYKKFDPMNCLVPNHKRPQFMKPGVLLCKFCEYQCDDPYSLKRHIEDHQINLKTYRCIICGMFMRCPFDMRKHMAYVHQRIWGPDMSKTPMFDEETLKLLNGRAIYIEFSENGVTYYQCTVCAAKGSLYLRNFFSKQGIVEHYGLAHSKMPPIKCPKCLCCKIDTGNRPKCTLCSTYYDAMYVTTLEVLREKHVTAPESIVPSLLVCRVCNYKAMDRATIIRHVKYSHTCYRPYGCRFCDFMGADATIVRKHIRIHHPEITGGQAQLRMMDEYKDLFDDVASYLALALPSKDRDVCIFEGDLMPENVSYLEIQDVSKNHPGPKAAGKRMSRKRTQNINYEDLVEVPPLQSAKRVDKSLPNVSLEKGNKTAALEPVMLEGKLYLDVITDVKGQAAMKSAMKRKITHDTVDPLMKRAKVDEPSPFLHSLLTGERVQEVNDQDLAKEIFEQSSELAEPINFIDNPQKDKYRVDGRRHDNVHFACAKCDFTTSRFGVLETHMASFHGHKEGTTNDLDLRHWQCGICSYRAKDRSCIGRHVKYMHMSRRPHSCPYCLYSSIEKTKVRMHVIASHKGEPVVVYTDQNLAAAMSEAVKKHIYLVEGVARIIKSDENFDVDVETDCATESSCPNLIQPFNFSTSIPPEKLNRRLKVNLNGYFEPSNTKKLQAIQENLHDFNSLKDKKSKTSSNQQFDDDVDEQNEMSGVEWAAYDLQNDEWIDLGKSESVSKDLTEFNSAKIKDEPTMDAGYGVDIAKRTGGVKKKKKMSNKKIKVPVAAWRDEKLKMKAVVKVKDIMTWMVKNLEKKYSDK